MFVMFDYVVSKPSDPRDAQALESPYASFM